MNHGSQNPAATLSASAPDPTNKRVLIYPVHRTVEWWRYVGKNLGWGETVVVSDLRGEGDISVVDNFYREVRHLRAMPEPTSLLLDAFEVADVIARCRVLRWLDSRLAKSMVHAMAIVMDRALEQVDPRVVLSFPIDRYVSDVLERRARARGVRYLEVTANVVPRMSMLMYRGALVQTREIPTPELTRRTVDEIANPSFTPSYVQTKTKYTRGKFVRTLGYFRIRAAAFKLISWAKRDPLNLHYLDAQPFLGHKCRWKDMRVVDLWDTQWRDKLYRFPKDKRLMIGLQLFPEASLDYWLRNLELIDNYDLIVEVATAFSEQGYLVLVKDHPSQFGFRQTELFDRLLKVANVVIVPYDISGNELLSLTGVSFTCTGTLGLQAALAGLTSVVTDSYYAEDADFVIFHHRAEVAGLPQRVRDTHFDVDLSLRRERIISHLLRGSFEADFFSFQGFDPENPSAGALQMAQALGRQLDQLVSEGEL